MADGQDLRNLVSTTCAKLTQDNILVGVSNELNQSVRQPTKKEADALRKRDAKKDRKDEEKINKLVKREEGAALDLDDNIILKINFSRFLAEERRDAVIALARKKYQWDGENEDNLLKVFMGLVKFESESQAFYSQLSQINALNENEQPRLQGVSVYDLKDYVADVPDVKLVSSLKLLIKDRANIVCEAGIDKKT